MLFKKSETAPALRKFYFVCVDDTDGKTPETGLTFSGAELQTIKAGAAFANMTNSGSVVERTDGLYEGELTETEVNTAGAVGFKIEKTGVRTTVMVLGQVVSFDPHDAVRMGLTALPNANAEAAGGLYTRGTGAGQINQPANGMVDVNAIRHLGTAYATPTVAGVPEIDVTHWNGTAVAVPTTAGVPRVDVKAMEANVVTAAAIADAAIDYATLAADAVGALGIIRRNTATAGGASTITLDASASATDSFYKHTKILIASGTGAGQVRAYASYVGATKVYTVDSAWSTNPDATSVFVLFAEPAAATTDIAAIKAKTDNLTDNPVDLADLAAVYTALLAATEAVPNTLLEVTAVLGSHTLADLTRLMIAVLAGPVLDFNTDTLIFKCPVTGTTRCTGVRDSSGRYVPVLGDLT